MRSSVITGGCGFIGSHLARRLLDDGEEVTVLDAGDFAPDQGALARSVRHVRGDILDPAAVESAIRPGVDVVYHLAAVVGVDQYIKRPVDVINVNFSGTRHILDAAERAGARLVFSSTSEVFGKNPNVPWGEDADRVLGSTATERWGYATSKALAEHLVHGYVRQRGVDAAVVRYFNVYGPGQRPAYVVSRNVHRALSDRPPIVYDGGTQTRCFTYIGDAIEATVLVARHAQSTGESFNIGSSRETAMSDVTALITSMCGSGTVVPTELDVSALLAGSYEDLQRRIPDPSKAARLLGWRATTDLRDGLQQTIDWAQRNPWWLEQDDVGQGQ